MAVELIKTAINIIKTVEKIDNTVKATRKVLKYADLYKYSFSTLKKMGFSEKVITNKLRRFYLNEGRQLILNPEMGQTVSSALRKLKYGRLTQGVLIPKTARTNLKNDIKSLEKLEKYFGNNSFANKLLTSYRKGEMNFAQLHNSVQRFTNNIEQYEDKNVTSDEINLIIDSYNPEINAMAKGYTRKDVMEFYEESRI